MNQREFDERLSELITGFHDLLEGLRSLFTDSIMQSVALRAALDESRRHVDLVTTKIEIDPPVKLPEIAEVSVIDRRRPSKVIVTKKCVRCDKEYTGTKASKLCDDCRLKSFQARAELMRKGREAKTIAKLNSEAERYEYDRSI